MLERHPRWMLHFTPTSSSWLNAVEGFFAKLTRRQLKYGVFHSLVDLQAAINRFIAEHNRQPKPFIWKADPDNIIAARKRGFQTLESIHYPGGVALCHDELPSHLFPDNAQALIDGRTPKPDRVKSALLSLSPEGDVLSIVLHSVSGLWGYSLYSHGSVVRCAAGSSDEGVFANIGAPLPEELPLLQNSRGAMDEFGEDLTFEATTRFFGRRLDDFEEIPLQMTQFRKPPATGRSFFGKRFGRG